MSTSLEGFGRFAEKEEEEVAEVRRSLCMMQTPDEAAANTAWGCKNPHAVVDKVDLWGKTEPPSHKGSFNELVNYLIN